MFCPLRGAKKGISSWTNNLSNIIKVKSTQRNKNEQIMANKIQNNAITNFDTATDRNFLNRFRKRSWHNTGSSLDLLNRISHLNYCLHFLSGY